ncbi:MAG: hypothetical protein AAF490_05635 [Chloroflexota bacterium]
MSTISTRLDHFMDYILFVTPMNLSSAPPQATEDAFSFLLLLSGTRCVLQYILLPFVLPLVGIAIDATAPLLIGFNVLAILSIVFSLRHFWRIRFGHRWVYFLVSVAVIFLLGLLIRFDLQMQ